MLEKPNRKKVDRQYDGKPDNIEQVIEKYGLETIWSYMADIVDSTNQNTQVIDNLSNIINTAILNKSIAQHPVGSLEFNVSGTNPSSYLGFGTWSLWGSGKVPVGVDTNDTDFNTVEKTGGAKTVTLTKEQIPAHSHTFKDGGKLIVPSGNEYGVPDYVLKNGQTITTNETGGGQAHTNVQPYITCYMWKRTA